MKDEGVTPVPDPFRIVFPSDDDYFITDPSPGALALVEGGPGIGKTITSFGIAFRAIREDKPRRVLYISIEQDAHSLLKQVDTFFPESRDSTWAWKGGKWSKPEGATKCDSPDANESCLIIWQAEWLADSSENGRKFFLGCPRGLADYLYKIEEYVREKIGTADRNGNPWKWDLIVVDNSNVLAPADMELLDRALKAWRDADPSAHPQGDAEQLEKERESNPGDKRTGTNPDRGAEAAGGEGKSNEESNKKPDPPLTRDTLREVYALAKDKKLRVLLVMEGLPSISKGSQEEFFCDIVIRLRRNQIEGGFRKELTVLKSRNQPTSRGVHLIDLSEGKFKLWPSPESVLKYEREKLLKQEEAQGSEQILNLDDNEIGQSGIEGWQQDAELAYLIRKGDTLLVAGPNRTGKTALVRTLLEACSRALQKDSAQPNSPYAMLQWRHGSTPISKCEDLAAPWKGRPRIIAIDGNPFWSRNQLFFSIYRTLSAYKNEDEPEARSLLVGLENLHALTAAFPLVAQDKTFGPALVTLLRAMGFTSIVEAYAPELDPQERELFLANQVARVADVVFRLDRMQTEGGYLTAISVGTAEDRGVESGMKFRWDAPNRKVSKRDLEAFVESAPGKLVRPHLRIALPYFSPNERAFAAQLALDAKAVVGTRNFSFIGITNEAYHEFEVDPGQYRSSTQLLNRQSTRHMLRNMALYPQTDLNIICCEDDMIPVETPIKVASNSEKDEKAIPLIAHETDWFDPAWLEPLGKPEDQEWSEWSDHGNLLVPFILNSSHEIIAVPYALDLGILLKPKQTNENGVQGNGDSKVDAFHFRAMLDNPDELKESERTLAMIGRLPKTTSENADMLKPSKWKLEIVGGLTKEACLALLVEALISMNPPPPNDASIDSWDENEIRDVIVRLSNITRNPDQTACQRGWYSQLSIDDKDTGDKTDTMRAKFGDIVELSATCNVYPISFSRWFIHTQYLVVPRGTRFRPLAIQLIKAFCREYAYQRMLNLVGFSPFRKDYEQPLLPWLEDLHKPGSFRRRIVTRQQLFGANYGFNSIRHAALMQMALQCMNTHERTRYAKALAQTLKESWSTA